MSEVTNLILHLDGDFLRQHALDIVNNEVAFQYGVPPDFKAVIGFNESNVNGPWYGGGKYLECDIYCGAIKNLDLDALTNAIRNHAWPEDAVIQLIVKEQDIARFRIIDVI